MPHCVNVESFLIFWATLLEILCSPFPGQGMRILIKAPEELLKGSVDKGENFALLGSIKSLVARVMSPQLSQQFVSTEECLEK